MVAATTFSLSAQAFVLGDDAAGVAGFLHVSPGLLLLGLLPHAMIELTALFLPLAAWIIASRRGEWDQLLAATFVTVAIAVPMLVVAALIEVYVSPHLFTALTRHPSSDRARPRGLDRDRPLSAVAWLPLDRRRQTRRVTSLCIVMGETDERTQSRRPRWQAR